MAKPHLGPGNENAFEAEIKVTQFSPNFATVGM